MTEARRNPENLNLSRSQDFDPYRNGSLDMELDRLGRKLRTGLVNDFRASMGCHGRNRWRPLRRWWRGLSECYDCRSVARRNTKGWGAAPPLALPRLPAL